MIRKLYLGVRYESRVFRGFSKAMRPFGHITVVLCALAFGTVGEAQVLPFVTLGELIEVCKNNAPDPQAFCLGYIEGAALSWKMSTDCASETDAGQTRCAAAKAAEAEISRFLMECEERVTSYFRNDPEDQSPRVEQVEMLRKCFGGIRTEIQECPRDPEQAREFCTAYDVYLEGEVASTEVMHAPVLDYDWRYLSLGRGHNEVALHGFIDEVYQSFPCLPFDASPEQVKIALMEYVDKNPGQQWNDETPTAIMLLSKAVFQEICPGPGNLPNIESCTKWQDFDGQWGSKNLCAEDIDIQFFLVSKGQTVGAMLAPGDVFLTGFEKEQVDADGWMYTACPSGYQSTASFVDDSDLVKHSQYHCRLK